MPPRLLLDPLSMRADPGLNMYEPGDIVPWHFIPGIVVASFFASLSGTLLTIEMLHRKRTGSSVMSRVHLFACALSMGLIGIWCMHFIGNRSIALSDGDDGLQLVYDSAYTGLSCVCPVLGLSVAFYIAELRIRSFVVRRLLDVVTGLLAGLSIVGMHYIGNLGAVNYSLIYPWRFIIASCTIAVGDCILALALFFYFKERWIGVFWKRFICAVLLAIGVCGMHFTASIGCTYRLTRHAEKTAARRNTPVIVAATMCFVAAISILAVLFYTHHRNRILADRAQQVMLACAFFDEEGNIMVTNEGALPSQRIAERFALQKFDDEFGVHHPVFHWIWKVSHSWDSVSELIPKMRLHVRRSSLYARGTMASSSTNMVSSEESYHDSTILFREGFCVAAADLAAQLQSPLSQLGALYDQVLGTGFLAAFNKGFSSTDSAIFERGQLMFFTRKLRPGETDHYNAAGFRFAPLSRVESMIAKTMQIPTDLLDVQMERVHEYAQRTSMPPPPRQGSYFVCLAALARVRSTFTVLVPENRQEDLPDVRLTSDTLTPWRIEYLGRFDGWSAERMIRAIEWKNEDRSSLCDDEQSFVVVLHHALASLVEQLGEQWFLDLVFSAQPLFGRYGATKAQKESGTVVFGFSRLLDIHLGALRLPRGHALANWDFVRLRQNYYPGCDDHGRMHHTIHAEFGPFLTKHTDGFRPEERRSSIVKVLERRVSLFGRARADSVFGLGTTKSDLLSEAESVGAGRESTDTGGDSGGQKQLWGGILATTDTIIVETSELEGGIELSDMTPQVTARATALSAKEPMSYMDCMYAQAKSHSCQVPKGSPLKENR